MLDTEEFEWELKTVHELRTTEAGRAELRRRGTCGPHVSRSADRPFVAWDGEGVTDDTGHHYILFGASDGSRVSGPDLTTIQCLETLLDSEEHTPDVIHVSFSFKYDSEMILRSLSLDEMSSLYKESRLRWGQYTLQYFPGKWFAVSGRRKGRKLSAKIWDLFGFFQYSFVTALTKMFPNENIDSIIAGKNDRSTFRYDQLERIEAYWSDELQWMVKLAGRLRTILYEAHLNIVQWHGPGAIAQFLFKKHRIDEFRQIVPDEVTTAARYAFTAGRFEAFKIGRACRRVYVYDINSAHPAGIAALPSLKRPWRQVTTMGPVGSIGCYSVSYNFAAGVEVRDIPRLLRRSPQPLFHRNVMGLVSYPLQVAGFYWRRELDAILVNMPPERLIIHSGWELEDSGERPFEFVRDLYELRRIYKANGVSTELAMKLAMNSLFGKMAQKVGWSPEHPKIPHWHQLEWAGMATANTRALLWPGMVGAHEKGALISVDTDAIFSTEPLNLDIGTGLGQWGYKTYADMVYLQNGIYWLQDDDGKWHNKFRGLDPDSLTIDTVLRYLEQLDLRVEYPTPEDSVNRLTLTGRTTRFVGAKVARHRGDEYRCTWETGPRDVHVGNVGKRVHIPSQCTVCSIGDYVPPGRGFHDLVLPHAVTIGGHQSWPHQLPWIEGIDDVWTM